MLYSPFSDRILELGLLFHLVRPQQIRSHISFEDQEEGKMHRLDNVLASRRYSADRLVAVHISRGCCQAIRRV